MRAILQWRYRPRWIWSCEFGGLATATYRKLDTSALLQYYSTPKDNDVNLEKIHLRKTAAMTSISGVENISRSFKEHIQTTDDLNVDALFDFLLVFIDHSHPTFSLVWLKLNMNHYISWDWLREIRQLALAVISVEFYLCLAFSDLTCHVEDTG